MKPRPNSKRKVIARAKTDLEKIDAALGLAASPQVRVARDLALKAWSIRMCEKQKAPTGFDGVDQRARENFVREVGRLVSEVLIKDDIEALEVLIEEMKRQRRIAQRTEHGKKPDPLRFELLILFPVGPVIDPVTRKRIDNSPRNWKELEAILSARLDGWGVECPEQSAVLRVMKELGRSYRL